MIDVTITRLEVLHASHVAMLRQVVNLGQPNRHGLPEEEALAAHVDGAIAEYVVAKTLDRHWMPLATAFKALPGDVGAAQVRSTRRANGSLILHPSDRDDSRFYLVVAVNPPTDYRVVGSILAGDGKTDEWWRSDVRAPAWFVPQGALEPV